MQIGQEAGMRERGMKENLRVWQQCLFMFVDEKYQDLIFLVLNNHHVGIDLS